jgi:uncharacterized membrane protein YjdF
MSAGTLLIIAGFLVQSAFIVTTRFTFDKMADYLIGLAVVLVVLGIVMLLRGPVKIEKISAKVEKISAKEGSMKINWKAVANILSFAVSMFLFIGICTYIALAYFGKSEPPGFELAVVSSIFGGLLLSGGLTNKAVLSAKMRTDIKQIGILYLVATIGFVFLVLFLPIARLDLQGITYWVVFLILALSMFGSAWLFSIATAKLIKLVPALWS